MAIQCKNKSSTVESKKTCDSLRYSVLIVVSSHLQRSLLGVRLNKTYIKYV